MPVRPTHRPYFLGTDGKVHQNKNAFAPKPKEFFGFTVDEWMGAIAGGADAEIFIAGKAGGKVALKVATLAETRSALEAGVKTGKIMPDDADRIVLAKAEQEQKALLASTTDTSASRADQIAQKAKTEQQFRDNAKFWKDRFDADLKANPADSSGRMADYDRYQQSLQQADKAGGEVETLKQNEFLARDADLREMYSNEGIQSYTDPSKRGYEYYQETGKQVSYETREDYYKWLEGKVNEDIQANKAYTNESIDTTADALLAQMDADIAETRAGMGKSTEEQMQGIKQAGDDAMQTAEEGTSARRRIEDTTDETTPLLGNERTTNPTGKSNLPKEANMRGIVPKQIAGSVLDAKKVQGGGTVKDQGMPYTGSVGGGSADDIPSDLLRRRAIEDEDPTGFTHGTMKDEEHDEFMHIPRREILFALQEAEDAYDTNTPNTNPNIRSVKYSNNGKARFVILNDGTRWLTFRGTQVDESQTANMVEQGAKWGAELMKYNPYTKPFAGYVKNLRKFFKIGTQYIMGGFDDVLTDTGAVFVNLEVGLGIPAIMDGLPTDMHGIVHMNFAHHVAELYDECYNFLQEKEPTDKFYIAGHSLGAVAGQIFMLRYFLETKEKPEKLYTFGSPRGLELFGTFYDDTFTHINIYDKFDPVPLFFPMMYTSHGYKIVLDSFGKTVEKYNRGENAPDLVVDDETTYEFMRRKQFNWGVSSVPDGEKKSMSEFVVNPDGSTSERSRLDEQMERLAKNPKGEQVRAFAESLSYELQQKAIAKATYYYTQKGIAGHQFPNLRKQCLKLDEYIAFMKSSVPPKPWYHKLHKQMTFPDNWEQQVQAWQDDIRKRNTVGNWSEQLETVANEEGGTLQMFRQNNVPQSPFVLSPDTPILGYIQYPETEKSSYEYKIIYYR